MPVEILESFDSIGLETGFIAMENMVNLQRRDPHRCAHHNRDPAAQANLFWHCQADPFSTSEAQDNRASTLRCERFDGRSTIGSSKWPSSTSVLVLIDQDYCVETRIGLLMFQATPRYV